MTTYRTQYTYSAATPPFSPGAAPESVFTISGNATNNIYVLKMGISTVQTTAGANEWFIFKLSTPNIGGTFGDPAVVPHDSNNPAASAVPLAYTAVPDTPGTVVGAVWGGWVNSPIVTTAGIGNSVVEVDFADMFGEPITLLSANEVLAWSFNGAALPAGLTAIAYCVWYESPKS